VAAIVFATVSTVLPGFLIVGMSVQVREDFGVSEGRYGWALGAFFLGAAIGSILVGRLVQNIGPRLQISASLVLSALFQLGIATIAGSFLAVVALLGLCGIVNSANQTAVNLALTQARLPRLGLAVALKQSGMPTASVLAGFAVPALALTVGWRWAYIVGVVMTLSALVAVRLTLPPVAPADRKRVQVIESPRSDLMAASVAGLLLAFTAGALNAWVVESGVDAGLGAGVAGVMLGVGAGSGVAARLVFGLRADSMTIRPFRMAAITTVVGVIGISLLGLRTVPVHMVATIVAFAGGWVWPVFTNFGILRTNPLGAGAATGITQMGVYVGVFTSPILTGWLIEACGYGTMWLAVSALGLAGAALSWLIGDRF